MTHPIAWLARHWALAAAVLLVACGALGYSLAAPAPPRMIRIAVGTDPDSAYTRAAAAYAQRLEATGFRVRRIPTRGSVENLELLRTRQVDVAIVQGGIADPARNPGLESLGAVFPEPVWAFVTSGHGITRLADLRGRRVAIGPEGSGTRELALALLAANGIGPGDVEALPLGGMAAAEALLAGEADGAILVSARVTGAIGRLMAEAPGVSLIDFAGLSDAYAVRLPFLTTAQLPRGALSIAEDRPDAPVTLLAPVASVVTNEDIHPQVVSLLVSIMQEVHRPRTLFAAEGAYPHTRVQDLPVHSDAGRYYARGRTFLHSWLPFWIAVMVERVIFILLPVIGIALPLIRFGPMLYAWQMEARVWRHYDTLRRIEADADRATAPEDREALGRRLEELEERVAHLHLPATYRRHVFALRRDIAYVRGQFAPHPPAGAEPGRPGGAAP